MKRKGWAVLLLCTGVVLLPRAARAALSEREQQFISQTTEAMDRISAAAVDVTSCMQQSKSPWLDCMSQAAEFKSVAEANLEVFGNARAPRGLEPFRLKVVAAFRSSSRAGQLMLDGLRKQSASNLVAFQEENKESARLFMDSQKELQRVLNKDSRR
ncbi:hypothetical protein [Anaeromyxobacter paludicola]|uniref:hypothetical protein n=1 Tax=Anaeromyxobacter paludicola TaxID=2918171 RepID=UPI0020BD4DAC|nr:hypothetical protein [Anaeromyxobacter paludicola]